MPLLGMHDSTDETIMDETSTLKPALITDARLSIFPTTRRVSLQLLRWTSAQALEIRVVKEQITSSGDSLKWVS